jgi:hypothetical protein
VRIYTFHPYIYVQASLRTPTFIMGAIFMGTGHKHIDIPPALLTRTAEEQREWVSARIQQHYRENDGKCPLFGDIVGYTWYQTQDAGIPFDIDGKLIETEKELPSPPTVVTSVTVGNKIISAAPTGGLSITPHSQP